MSQNSKIEWTDATWNPVTGCTPAGVGCMNCYARRMAETRLRGRHGYPEDEPFRVTWHPEKLNEPLRWRKPRRVFVCSMGDLFHADVIEAWQDEVFRVMDMARRHTFLVLTKRVRRMWDYVTSRHRRIRDTMPNIWLGASASDQANIESSESFLLDIKASVRFWSLEPLLSRVTLGFPNRCNWVIVGCETGPNRRPCKLEWVRAVRDQCRAAGVPLFVKKLDLGGYVSSSMDEWPADLRIREWPEVGNHR